MRLGFLAGVCAVAACSGGASNLVGPELFTYSAETRVTSTTPMRFETTMTLKNATPDAITFTPSCPLPRVLIYSSSNRSGTPFWDSISSTACATVITNVTLASGESKTYTLAVNGAQVLGASGTAGTYYVSAEVTLSGIPIRLDAGQVALAR